MGCERLGEFHRLFGSRQAAKIHIGMTPDCRAPGLGVREISVAAGTGADVMAGGAGAAGPTPDVCHQPQGYPDLLPYNNTQTYPTSRLSRDIPGYPGITRPGVYPVITNDNPA